MSVCVLSEVRKGTYLDSVALMRLSRRIAAMPAVSEAALMMATPANRQILAAADLLADHAASAGGNDLIIAVRAESREAAEAALAEARAQLDRPRAASDDSLFKRQRTLKASPWREICRLCSSAPASMSRLDTFSQAAQSDSVR